MIVIKLKVFLSLIEKQIENLFFLFLKEKSSTEIEDF